MAPRFASISSRTASPHAVQSWCGRDDPAVDAAWDSAGKPFLDGYLAAADELRIPAAECVVVEDTPAGVDAGHAAGMRVIGVLTTYGRKELACADFLIAGVHAMTVEVVPGRPPLRLRLDP